MKEGNLHRLRFSNGFLNVTETTNSKRKKINWASKLKTASKDTIKKVVRQFTSWEKIFTEPPRCPMGENFCKLYI